MSMPWEDDINWGNTATTVVKGEPMSEIFGKECLNCQEWDCTWCPIYVEYQEKIKRWEDEYNTERD